MISPETRALIRRYFFAEHWKIGTIVSELGVHPDTVRNVIESDRFSSASLRPSLADPYLGFVRQTLEQHPRLRATASTPCCAIAATPAVWCSSGGRWLACAHQSGNRFYNSIRWRASRRKSTGPTSAM